MIWFSLYSVMLRSLLRTKTPFTEHPCTDGKISIISYPCKKKMLTLKLEFLQSEIYACHKAIYTIYIKQPRNFATSVLLSGESET